MLKSARASIWTDEDDASLGESLPQPLDQLLLALDERWGIAEPVYRGLCDDTGYSRGDYYFTLKRGKSSRLVIVPACEHVRQFLRQRRLQAVDAYRIVPACE